LRQNRRPFTWFVIRITVTGCKISLGYITLREDRKMERAWGRKMAKVS
jgi:hypothetical protein